MAQENLTDVFKRNQYNLRSASRKSRAWFEQQVGIIARQQIGPMKVFSSPSTDMSSSVMPGNLYMFFYSAKHRETLPYWDRFPLVFPFSKTENGFIGLNMHYLPYQLRVQLLQRLMMFSTNKNMDSTTKLKYSWETISNVSKFNAAKPCVKRYLSGYVKSQFKMVDPSDWATAMLLPVESFTGANKIKVWEDSQKAARR
jgi:hypothetical protein